MRVRCSALLTIMFAPPLQAPDASVISEVGGRERFNNTVIATLLQATMNQAREGPDWGPSLQLALCSLLRMQPWPFARRRTALCCGLGGGARLPPWLGGGGHCMPAG